MNAVLSAVTVDFKHENHESSVFDLSDLSPQEQMTLQIAVGQFRHAQNRVVHEMYGMFHQLVLMKEILGTRFYPFVRAEFAYDERTVRRWLDLHKVLLKHFSTNGMINAQEASRFPQNVLRLLAHADEDVVTEIKEIAEKGGKISESTVKEIIARSTQDYEVRLASATAEAESKQQELEALKSQSELERLRLQQQIARNDEMLRRANEQNEALQHDLTAMQAKETIVTEKIVEKEVIPAGYSNAMEAINAATKMLADKKAEAAAIEKQNAELRAQMAEMNGGAEEFLKLKQQVDALITMYPNARLHAIASTDVEIKRLIAGMGQALVELGTQIHTAANSSL